MKTTKTQKFIYKMLTTNTGSHICDSGGAYGRHWERNGKKSLSDFLAEPQVFAGVNSYTTKDGEKRIEYDYTINLFHFLDTRLYLDELCDKFNRTKSEEWDGEVYGTSKKQEARLKKNDFEIDEAGTQNSYGYDSNLSQVIQYTPLTRNGVDDYVLLQVHQGCDVRGGYTDAKLFRTENLFGLRNESVGGDIDGVGISNGYDGIRLRYDGTDEEGNELENNEKEIDPKEDSKINLFLYE